MQNILTHEVREDENQHFFNFCYHEGKKLGLVRKDALLSKKSVEILLVTDRTTRHGEREIKMACMGQ